jgi:flagellar protein FliO/FliZ
LLFVLVPASGAETGFKRDQTPLPAKVTGAAGGKGASSSDPVSSGATLHMLLGLALVLGLIYGLYRLLKRSSDKNEKVVRGGDDWMSVIASTRIAPSRSVHLIRVGEEIVLVGSGEQGVTPIRVYTAEEARRLRIEPNEPLVAGAGALADAPRGFVGTLLEQLRKKTAR